jgi:DNA-directed DNA polymerase III PolC
MDAFVHLEVQSAFSFLWGTFTPEDLVREVSALGQRAVALTDYGLHGAVRFYQAAVAAGIQPLVGLRVAIWDGSMVTLIAADFEAYGNLCRIASLALGESMAPRAPITRQDIKHYSKGVICLAGGRGSRVESMLKRRRKDSAKIALQELRDVIHNPEWLFVALQNHVSQESDHAGAQEAYFIMEETVELANSMGLPVVGTNSATFLKQDDYILHRGLVSIQRRHHHRNIEPLPNNSFFLTSGQEMERRIPYPDALQNTGRIASLCRSFALPLGKLHPPRMQGSEESPAKLAALCLKEIARLRRPAPAVYLRRLDMELEAIRQMDLGDFFLLVREVVDFARAGNIRHSIRGSAAGSLAVYLLLGGVDPVAHDLLFERFINEGRGDLPDIDVDFDSDRRNEVIQYLLDRFPKRTAMVCAIHAFRVRSAVRLAARALGYPLDEIKRLSTCLPWSLRGRDLIEALETLPELRNAPIQREKQLIEMAAKLTGLPFQCSVHLGGVIIAAGEIKTWTPVGHSPKGLPVGQLDKDDTEALGLLKLDLLGLRMHTAIRKALEIVEEKGVHIDLERLPLDDRKTYSLLRSTESVGVFQLESPGQRSLLGHLQPRCFTDLIAQISLFRPGPVEGDMVSVYVRRRHGEEAVQVLHPDLLPILEETYGVILFQEQVLRIVHVFAGLSYAQADAFRRAMTKDRRSKKMELLKERFFEGALSMGHPKELVEEVFEKVAAFASYGFCKAHAASFAHITYQSSFLKAHHPQAFYLGLLNAGQVGSYPPYVILNEARRRGVPIHPPHVNSSGLEYEAEGAGIRAPLVVVNGVGPAMARRIVADRQRRGPFHSARDFIVRVKLPDRIVQALQLAAAMEGLNDNQWELVQEVSNA